MSRRKLPLSVAAHLDGIGAGKFIDIVREDGKRVGCTYDQTRPSSQLGTWSECEAYARLFAASEDLLAALKYARRFLNSNDHDTAYVDSVIAKAEGTQPA